MDRYVVMQNSRLQQVKTIILLILLATQSSLVLCTTDTKNDQPNKPENNLHFSHALGAWGLMLGCLCHCFCLPKNAQGKVVANDIERVSTFILVPIVLGSTGYVIGYILDLITE